LMNVEAQPAGSDRWQGGVELGAWRNTVEQ
jgi:hypothetical protein